MQQERELAQGAREMMLSKEQMEAEICQTIRQFELQYMGGHPNQVRVICERDFITALVKGVFTPAEQILAKSQQGSLLVKQMRNVLLDQGRETLAKRIAAIIGRDVSKIFADIDASSGEGVMVFTLCADGVSFHPEVLSRGV
ncbi:MAG: hypothetical protein C4293_15870 [Nitrospiraceae bacterium]